MICTAPIPVLPATGQDLNALVHSESKSTYICGKPMPCLDHEAHAEKAKRIRAAQGLG